MRMVILLYDLILVEVHQMEISRFLQLLVLLLHLHLLLLFHLLQLFLAIHIVKLMMTKYFGGHGMVQVGYLMMSSSLLLLVQVFRLQLLQLPQHSRHDIHNQLLIDERQTVALRIHYDIQC